MEVRLFKCSECKIEKPLDCFGKRSRERAIRSLSSLCKQCDAHKQAAFRQTDKYKEVLRKRKEKQNKDKSILKKYNLKQNYGISIEDYDALFQKQNGACAICYKKEEKLSDGRSSLGIDHCHKTGKIRGILCAHCNNILGRCNDDMEILSSALLYLKRNHTKFEPFC